MPSALSPLEYRQARRAIRDTMSLLLDQLDGVQAALAAGEAKAAREAARALALTADDLTAWCERVVRLTTYQSEA